MVGVESAVAFLLLVAAITEADRRAGDPASIVAGATRIRTELNWEPKLNDLRGIVKSAFDWENTLRKRNR